MGNKGSPQKSKKPKAKIHMRVLNVGISGSGKSTFAKQMKIIASGGFTVEEKEAQREVILVNLLLGIKDLIHFAEQFNHTLLPKNLKHSRFFTGELSDLEWNDKIIQKIKQLWNDPAIQDTWKLRFQIDLQIAHLDYFIDNIDRITSPDFVPTNEDILRARQRTTGELTVSFIHEKIAWEFVDVGGQRPERNKWDPIIKAKLTDAIIYFISLEEYNVPSSEELNKTKLDISFEVWSELARSELLSKTTIILFLNKLDLFKQKLANEKDSEQFIKLFPEYRTDGDTRGTDFIKKKFLEAVPDRTISTHAICALDTSLIEMIFKEVKNTIFDTRVNMTGIKL